MFIEMKRFPESSLIVIRNSEILFYIGLPHSYANVNIVIAAELITINSCIHSLFSYFN